MGLVAGPDDTRINGADNHEQSQPERSFSALLSPTTPGLIVGADGRIVHLGRGVGRFLHVGEGAPSYDLLSLVQPQLQPALQAAFFASRQQNQTEARRAAVAIDGAVEQIDVRVQPITEPEWARDHWLVLFQAVRPTGAIGADGRVEQLEADLSHARLQFQDAIEQFTAADLSERQQAEKTLRLSQERYHTLFESIDEGFCVIEIIFDADNQPIDYRFIEINPVFEKQTGLVDALGKTMRALIPQHEQHWFDIYGKVALTGEPIRFESPARELNRWFDLYAFRVGEPASRRVAVLFNDITERKRREMSTALLADIQEEFARLSSTDEIMQIVGEKIAAFFGFSLLAFTEVNAAADEVLVMHVQREADVTSPAGLLRLGNFLGEPYIGQLKAGRTIAIDDVTTDPDTTANGAAFLDFQIGSLMLAPYLSDGRLKFILSGHLRRPYSWRQDELELMSELAARVWLRLERAYAETALRLSEERYRTLFESIDEGFCIFEMLFDADNRPIDYRFLELNPAFERHTGLVGANGRTARELVPDLEEFWFETYGNVALTGKSIHFEQRAEQMHRWFDVYASRVGDANSRKVALVFNDITERKQAEVVLRESQARQAFLLTLGDRMRDLTSAEAIMAAATELLGRHLGVARVVYSEIEPSAEYALVKSSWTDGRLQPMQGRYRLDDFGVVGGYREGRMRRVADVRTDLTDRHSGAAYEALGARAVIGVPLFEGGRMSAILAVHCDAPRRWTDAEVELVHDVGQRIWSETKRALAEAKLRASEDRLRAIYDGTYEYIGLLAPDGTLLEANRASLEFADNTRADVVGQPFWATPWFTFTPGAPEMMRRFVARAAAGEFIRFEGTLNRPNGEIKTFDISLHPIRDAAGQVILILPEGRDITERKQVEQALKASEQQSRDILESITDAFFAVDRSWRFTYLNQQAERLLARASGELLGQNIWESYPSLVGSEFEQTYLRAADERIASSVTAFYPDHNRWYEVHAYPATSGITVYFRNVTQRIEAEAALRVSEERLRRAIEIETVGVIFFKPDGSITAANDAFLRMSGYTQADVANGLVRWDTQTPPEWMPISIHAIDEFLNLGRTTPYEKEYFRKDGSRWWGLFAATRINGEEGVEFVVDITENKRVEAERESLFHAAEQARREAEAALQTRDQFLSIASHELRTPLTSLMGYAHLLRTAVARGKGDLARMTDRITSQAQRLNALIEQLLDVSRLQRGQFAIERRPTDLAAVVAQVVDEFRATLPPDTKHPIEIHRPDEPVMIAGDAQRLEQVIQNLLSNAVKYSPSGGTVRVHVIHTATAAELVIEDQGIGIPVEARDQLFQPFYRASNVGEQVSGFGIGLHIVREIVQRHGGRIEVASTVGAGSCFRVVLPLSSDDGSAQPDHEPSV